MNPQFIPSLQALIVDDGEFDALVMREQLRAIGVKSIVSAGGVTAALDHMAAGHLIHMVLTDLEMPGRDGKELVRALFENPLTKHIPVIMTTTVDTPELRAFLKDHGAFYLKKGSSVDELRGVLLKCIPD